MNDYRRYGIILLFLLGIGFAASYAEYKPYSLLPAEEGLNMGVLGWQPSPYGTLYSSKNIPTVPDEPDPGYELISDSPHNYLFGYWHFWRQAVLISHYERTDVRVEVQQPYYHKWKEVQYSVKVSDNEYKLVKAEVWIYEANIDFSIINKGLTDSGVHVYQDVPVWISLVTTYWNRAVYDPGLDKEGTAWGAPISMYIEGYEVDQNSGTHTGIEPSYVGRFIDLYSTPSTAGTTIDDLGISLGLPVDEALEYSPSPDTRITDDPAYARFILSDFGPDTQYLLGNIISQKYPAVNYKVKIYYLTTGTWTYTNMDQDEWERRQAEYELWGPYAKWVWLWDDVIGNLNPFRVFGDYGGIVALLTLVAIAFIVLIILLKYGLPVVLDFYFKR